MDDFPLTIESELVALARYRVSKWNQLYLFVCSTLVYCVLAATYTYVMMLSESKQHRGGAGLNILPSHSDNCAGLDVGIATRK